DAVLADFYCNNWCRNEEVPFLCTSFCMDVLQIQRISDFLVKIFEKKQKKTNFQLKKRVTTF
ncbi:MAG: hypothetical protein LBM95_05085, partial [Lactobacillales bacterium]|nr:hypothetical protein [Lactobacillales bacterium]